MKRLPFKKRIGLALRARREALGLKQDEVAHNVGKHRVNYGHIENGKINIQIDTLEKLCLALGVLPSEIVQAADRHGLKSD